MGIESDKVAAEIENVQDSNTPEATSVCPTRLIEDVPSESDEFASSDGIGPHDRVATAIADMILSPDESGGKMIGLEGDWGAGKTTVITLLKNKLARNEEITLFSYDAWAHEGDPLRRTFLESLIRHFQNLGAKGWIEKADSDKELDILSKRRKVSKTRTIPQITILGKIFTLSVLLVPVSGPLLTKALGQGITIDSSRPFSWALLLGVICALAPFIVIFCNFIRIKFRTVKKEPNLAEAHRCSDAEKGLGDWAFIGSHSIEETTQETIETPQPTSIEFQDVFCKILGEALIGKPNRKVIMVLDNLDRVDPKDALSIWSTLQTFLQCRNDKTEDWFKKLWIVIPYDPEGLRQLWTNRGKSDGSSGGDDSQVVPESFLDKSFQLRFRVAPPLLSNWKEYLENLILQALPRHSHEEVYKIYQVFRTACVNGNTSPTPRQLKLFVNQIGTIHRQWQHEFPLDHIAYYTLLSRSREKICEELISGTLPTTAVRNIVSSPQHIVANLAGLFFNVKATLGQQLLLAEPIANALAKGDGEQLKKLEDKHRAAFWVVLESVMTEKRVGETAKEIANSARCLEALLLPDNNTGNEKNAIVAALSNSAHSVDVWAPFSSELADGIAAACKVVSNSWFSRELMGRLQSTIADPALKADVPVTKDAIQALARICEVISMNEDSFTLQPFALVVNATEWFSVCSHIHELDEKFWPLFTTQADIKEDISSLLTKIVSAGKFSAVEVEALRVTSVSPTNCDWPFVAKTLGERLLAGQEAATSETVSLLQGLSFLKGLGNHQAKESLKQLATNGHLMHRLHQAHTQKDDLCTAQVLFAFLEERPKADKPTTVGNSDAGFNILNQLLATDNSTLAKQLVDILEAENNLSMLFEIVDERVAYDQLIVSCLRLIADSDAPEVIFSPEVILNRWSDLWDHINTDEGGELFDSLLGKLCVSSSLPDVIQNAEGEFDYEKSWLYMRICMVCQSQSFNDWCRAGLESLSSEIWEKQLKTAGNVLDLLGSLVDSGAKVTLKQFFQDGLVNHAKGILAGGPVPGDDDLTQWPKLLDTMGDAASRKTLRRRLLSEVVGREGGAVDPFLKVYGEELLQDPTVFYEEKDLIAKLLSPLLRERNMPGLIWQKKVFDKIPDLLDKSTDRDSAEDFIGRIQGELGKAAEENDQFHALIEGLATVLGISVEITTDEEVVSDEEKESETEVNPSEVNK